MIRIVGIHREDTPQGEFILLQNQGAMRMNLKGHAVMSESAFQSALITPFFHLFGEDEFIFPGSFVLLSTGRGVPRWGKSKDGSHVFYTFMSRDQAIWAACNGPLHVLVTQHSYVERREPAISLN